MLFVPKLFKFQKNSNQKRDAEKSAEKPADNPEAKESTEPKEKKKKISRIVKMNEYQIMKLLNKCLSIKFCFVKVTKKYVLVLLNQTEEAYNKASKLLLNEEESGVLALDLAEFKEITDFSLVSKFYNNNRNTVIR
jgi:hypothetical protein